MYLEVKNAEYISDYQIKLEFNGDFKRVVDLKDELEGEIFEPLKDTEYFKNFHIDCGTLSWSNGADIAPEYLFLISNPASHKSDISESEKAIEENVKKLYMAVS